uniref:hypothetical protein n=1 Tax=Cephaleuros karstenii TaxID=1985640 RepID=UPI001EE03F02|nr:hypothetical protein MFR52_pgp093 [Cephaleuros karstenii]UIB39066.1 hypothetical protein [Cephaleuros karstenii]
MGNLENLCLYKFSGLLRENKILDLTCRFLFNVMLEIVYNFSSGFFSHPCETSPLFLNGHKAYILISSNECKCLIWPFKKRGEEDSTNVLFSKFPKKTFLLFLKHN